MITTEIAFHWFTAAFFLLPTFMPYRMPTFYDDQFRKNPNSPDSLLSYRESHYLVPAPGIFEPVWWIVGMATAAVAILYWQHPGITNTDFADTVFGLLYSIPFLQVLAGYLYFKPVSWYGTAVVCTVILAVIGCLWGFIIASGVNTWYILVLLSIPSVWAILVTAWTWWWAVKFPIDEAQQLVVSKHVALNQLLAGQMSANRQAPAVAGGKKFRYATEVDTNGYLLHRMHYGGREEN
jgi:hypothetical protein